MCGPSASVSVTGDSHGAGSAPSTLHAKVALASFDEKRNVCSSALVTPAGASSIVVSGAVMSTPLSGPASGMPPSPSLERYFASTVQAPRSARRAR